jgi:hypothetical protein
VKRDLTAERLRELLHYDPATGVFTRRVALGRRSKVGDVVGSRTAEGYLDISVNGGRYRAHRLAWLYATGRWPAADVDHLNGNRADNRFSNLRDVSRAVNLQNRHAPQRNNVSGLLGVAFDAARGKWAAHIKVDGRRRALGRFDTPEAAHAVYLAAKREHHQGNTL